MKKNNSDSDSENDENDSIDDESDDETTSRSAKDNKSYILKQFTPKEICYYKMINDFFEDREKCTEKDIEKMVLIISKDKKSQKSEISLRLIDWLVTTYSKKVSINIKTMDGEKQNLKLCYKSTLKTYKKRYFDPFKRRNKRIKFWYYYTIKGKEHRIKTTLGQLNFFKWAICNGVVKYVEDNLTALCKEMKKHNSETKKRKENDSSNDTIDSSSKKSVEKTKKIKTNNQVGIKNGKLEISFD